jgi:catechol 2,3-dioxygenase-like lactoylglutathione lyase family enzyme
MSSGAAGSLSCMASMTHLYSVIPVKDMAAALAWYAAFVGRPADELMGEEALWEISETAWLVLDDSTDRPGTALLTLGVTGLDDILARLAANNIEHDPVETYGNGVRHVNIHDPDGNRLSMAEAPA